MILEKKVDPRGENNSATVTSKKEPGNDEVLLECLIRLRRPLADLSEVTGQARKILRRKQQLAKPLINS